MFSLAVVDQLHRGHLVGSTFIASTSTIAVDGKVGQINCHPQDDRCSDGHGAMMFLV